MNDFYWKPCSTYEGDFNLWQENSSTVRGYLRPHGAKWHAYAKSRLANLAELSATFDDFDDAKRYVETVARLAT